MRCLVTGATGYIGGRLVPRLLAEGHTVRCLTRDRTRLRGVGWADEVSVVEGDLIDRPSVAAALADVEVAYYLVHSLGQRDFERIDRAAAGTFASAAREAGVRRVIYLGGPEPMEASRQVSAHLRSRAEVAQILLASGVPVAVLRAAVIIGSGSASFEMLRYLTERLPVMVAPRWVKNRVQPIAIADVLHYLVGCVQLPDQVSRAFDIGGPDVLSYADMMRRYAAVAGLPRRLILPVRPLTPQLSSYWVGLVTPVPAEIAKPLVASLIQEAVGRERDLARYLPDPPDGLIGFDEAVRLALARVRGPGLLGRPAGVGLATPAEPMASDPPWSGGTVYTDLRVRPVAAPAAALWRVIEGIGGESGWYAYPLAWSVRGWLDQLFGGTGLRRGRSDPHRLQAGEVVDWWRVDDVVPGRLLRLRAELRLPGRAWLELRAVVGSDGRTRYLQRVAFEPSGLAGHAYWAVMWPFHQFIFGGMARNIAATAARTSGGERRPERLSA